MTRKIIYTDLDLDFTKHPNTDDVSRVVNTNAVIRSFRNLVFTHYNDAPFQPAKGNWIANALFENDTPLTRLMIDEEIKLLASTFEPRVSNVETVIFMKENSYQVDISFSTIGQLEPVTFTLILERTR